MLVSHDAAHFYEHCLPSADSRKSFVGYWPKNLAMVRGFHEFAGLIPGSGKCSFIEIGIF